MKKSGFSKLKDDPDELKAEMGGSLLANEHSQGMAYVVADQEAGAGDQADSVTAYQPPPSYSAVPLGTAELSEAAPIAATATDASIATAPAPEVVETPHMTIKVQTITGQSIPVKLQQGPSATILDVKTQLFEHRDIPVDQQRILFGGREIQNEETLASINVEDGYTLHLLLRKLPTQGAAAAAAAANNDAVLNVDGAGAVAVDDFDVSDRLQKLARMSRAVKLFAVIDAMFLVIWSFSQWPFALGVALAYSGYHGAAKFNKTWVAVYLFYIVCIIGVRMYFLFSASEFVFVYASIIALGIFAQCYIFSIVFKFFQLIRQSLDEELNMLRELNRG